VWWWERAWWGDNIRFSMQHLDGLVITYDTDFKCYFKHIYSLFILYIIIMYVKKQELLHYWLPHDAKLTSFERLSWSCASIGYALDGENYVATVLHQTVVAKTNTTAGETVLDSWRRQTNTTKRQINDHLSRYATWYIMQKDRQRYYVDGDKKTEYKDKMTIK